ncbi:MAG: gamma-glutamyltransferase [Rhizobiaceae bacterium]
MRNLELPGRSPVMSTNGMAATSNPLATQVAIDVLKAGGNAMDASIAACAVQCVVEPNSTGIGGDCFALYAPQGKANVVAFNGSGRAPAAASLEKLTELGVNELTRNSAHSVIIPGAIDAWTQLHGDHGHMPLSELLQPAIGFARNGYPVSHRAAADFTHLKDHIKTNANLSAIFIKDGEVPAFGSLHHNPGLGNALEIIASEGRDGFYQGELAAEMVNTLQELGGLHTLEDFAEARGTYETTITTEYRGNIVHECPPQGQGMIALLMLNMMRDVPVNPDLLSADRIHWELETCRRGYGSRSKYLADPAQVDVAVEEILSQHYADQLRDDIDPAKSRHPEDALNLPPHKDTVYISVVDKDRNVCSFINTVFDGFGTAITTPRNAIVFTNRGQGFVLEKGHPNCIAPRKRPLHTIIPGMLEKDGRIVMSFGVMGGEYQAMGHLQFLTRVFDYGLDVQGAMDAPRFMVDPFSGEVEIEGAVPDAVVEELRSRGHEIARAKRPIGGSQAVAINWDNGVLTGGSDPRKDGCAIGY